MSSFPRTAVLPLENDLGLAPGLAALRPLYDGGRLGIIQGLGYPNPSRSHFRSMEIWQTGSPTTYERTGWLGRYLDANCCGEDDPVRAVNIGGSLAGSLWTDHTLVPSIANVEGYRFPTNPSYPWDREHQLLAFTELYGVPATGRPHDQAIRRVGAEFHETALKLATIAGAYRSTVAYPNGNFARGLKQVAQLLSADLGTRVAYVSLGGFDTHAYRPARTSDCSLSWPRAWPPFSATWRGWGWPIGCWSSASPSSGGVWPRTAILAPIMARLRQCS